VDNGLVDFMLVEPILVNHALVDPMLKDKRLGDILDHHKQLIEE
jgi:hypothetical protein